LTSAKAQLTQSNHAPANGDVFTMYQCDSVSPGAAGANTNWVFTINTHSSIQMSYTAATVNSPSYTLANIAVAATASNTAYYSSTASNLWYYGGNLVIGPVAANLNYSSPAIYASYPMSLNTTSTAPIAGTINVNQPLTANGTFTGTSSVLADATGTLSIAGMTFTNVTRVLISQDITFTTNIANGSLVERYYQFYANGIKAPIMTVETSTANLPFPLGSPTQTIVQRVKSAPTQTTGSTVGITEAAGKTSAIQLFPNPASSQLTVLSADGAATSLEIFDVTGKRVALAAFNGVWAKADVSELQNGLYIYTVKGQGNQTLESGRISVIH
jgi:hypothetical protein